MTGKLTDTAIRNAKASDKARKITDERGLYLLVRLHGGKWWRFKYLFGGEGKLLSLGVYPDISLADARERREAARKLVAQGIDPGAVRKEKQAKAAEDARTFRVVALEWYGKKRPGWTEATAYNKRRQLERELLPQLGDIPVKGLTPRC